MPTVNECPPSEVEEPSREAEGGILFPGCTTVAMGGGCIPKAAVGGGGCISECIDPPREEKEVDLHERLEAGAW